MFMCVYTYVCVVRRVGPLRLVGCLVGIWWEPSSASSGDARYAPTTFKEGKHVCMCI